MRHLDLFSGIGGFSLGLERAGFETVAFCEIDEYARKVLKKHWPNVPIYEDIRNVTAKRLRADGIDADVITAGVPCQAYSTAARGANNARDWWPETLQIIRQLRPIWIVIENVPSYKLEHIERACDDLEFIDYAVWPLDIACEIRNHVRRRAWIVAHANENGEPQCAVYEKVAGLRQAARFWWGISEPMGMADGIPHRLDRLRCLGNAIVPQIAEIIGRAILEVNQ